MCKTICEWSTQELTELAFYLPYGVNAEYFYAFMVYKLHGYDSNLENCLPKKQRDLFIKCCERAEQREAKKEEEAEKKKVS